MKHVEVVAAVIIKDDKILCAQRGKGVHDYISWKYEFPGGKVEKGETPEQAIEREIKEELEMDIAVDNHFLTVNHEYPDFKITLHSFICTLESEKFILKEHVAYKWLMKEELHTLDWVEADIAIVKKLEKELDM